MGEKGVDEKLLPQTTTEENVVEARLEEAGYAKPPDGGYGWIIVAASFFANLCVDGIIFTVGTILLPLWKKEFNTEDTQVSLSVSILAGSYLLIGPVASGLANAYGCRIVVIIGAVIAFFGFLLTTVAPHIFFVYLTFGLIGGIGLGLVYLPSLVIVSHYFEQKRALATGIAVCGSGIGTSIFATLNPHVMEMVGDSYRIFLVYIAIVALLGAIPGILYKPLQVDQKQLDKVAEIVQEYEVQSRKNSFAVTGGKGKSAEMFLTEVMFDTKRPFLSTLELNAQKTRNDNVWSQRDLVKAVARESVQELNRPLSRADIFYPGSMAALTARSRAPSATAVHVETDKKMASSVLLSRVGLPTTASPEEAPIKWSTSFLNTVKSMVDTTLLRRSSFLILALSGFLTLSCFYVPYNYLEKHIEKIENVTTSDKKLPISLLGIINIVARIGCGYIADRPQVDALLISNIAITLAGLATMAVPLFDAYWLFIAYCVPFAIGVACFAALRTIICAELYGVEKLSSAFGVLLLFMGIGATVGSPIAAFIKDQSGNFNLSFYVMGALMALSGVICFPLRKLRDREDAKEQEEAEYEMGNVA